MDRMIYFCYAVAMFKDLRGLMRMMNNASESE